VHVTLRTVTAVRCLRSRRLFAAIRDALAAASRRGLRVNHYSVQDNHLHLIVEADDARALRRGIAGLAIRVARAANRVLRRHGALWGDRYHARALTTPRAVRNALVYVLMNVRKHHGTGRGLDPCSSALGFDGWRQKPSTDSAAAPLVVRARTWLGSIGWRRHGLLRIDEKPKRGR
jgi:REP-associated tyrosine transposase